MLPSSIEGEIIVFREILIEGPIQKTNFFEARSKFIQEAYGATQKEYLEKSKYELEKINYIPSGSDVHLWFEDDLFCQCNLWYASANLTQHSDELTIYLVRPDSDSWQGFGSMSEKRLEDSFKKKTLLNQSHLMAFNQLWDLYTNGQKNIPANIIETLSSIIPRIEEVLKAHMDRLAPNNRPYESLKKIMQAGHEIDFKTAFQTFTEVEGIYGYGDSSIKKMYDKIIAEE